MITTTISYVISSLQQQD